MEHCRFINIIVAYEKTTFLFGNKKTNTLPWNPISKDLEHFKMLTTGHICIMGKHTYLSIPKKYRPLKNRVSIIVSKTFDNVDEDGGGGDSVFVCDTLTRAIELYAELNESGLKKCFVIGGYGIFDEISSGDIKNKIECIYATELTAIEHGLVRRDDFEPLYLPNSLTNIIETCSSSFTSEHYQFEQYHKQNEILYENGFIIEFKTFFIN